MTSNIPTTTPNKEHVTLHPKVTIVIPVYNDAQYLARALDSCLSQTLKEIEVICVDDKSTDKSIAIINSYIEKDDRIQLIKQKKNLSALQARRTGVESASAQYILFLDGDDVIHPDTAKLCYNLAVSKQADVVGFGARVVTQKGRDATKFEESLQPQYDSLSGLDIISSLFDPTGVSQGHIWGYLFDKSLIVKAYKHIPKTKKAYRANDIIISFAALSYAQHYVSINQKLYEYHFHVGSSGHEYIDYEKFLFYASAIDSVEILKNTIIKSNFSKEKLTTILLSFETMEMHIVSNVLRYCIDSLDEVHHKEAMDYITEKSDTTTIVRAATLLKAKYLNKIAKHLAIPPIKNPSKNIAIYTTSLDTGGVQGVVMSQARYLTRAGYDVTIIIRIGNKEPSHKLPKAVKVRKLTGASMPLKLKSFINILTDNEIDTVIDHNILYNTSWPYFALIAKINGIKTIGWIHSFSLRPAHDSNQLGSFLNDNLRIIDKIITLSKKDVAYWKILGHKNVYHLPNPPSPLLLDHPPKDSLKTPPSKTIKLIWYGRLDQKTKRLYSLLEVAEKLKRIYDDFTLRIIGPNSTDFTAKDLENRVKRLGLEDNVIISGQRRGEELIEEIKNAHFFVMTSDIEGYPLVITEAQAFGLPVVMYDLPWLAVAEHNDGLVQIPQGNSAKMARRIVNIAQDDTEYLAMSKGAIDAAKRYQNYNFPELYDNLLQNTLSSEFSPEPTLEDAKMFLRWHTVYLEKNARYNDRKIESLNEKVTNITTEKTAELRTLKNSRAYKTGEMIAKPIRNAKIIAKKVYKQGR